YALIYSIKPIYGIGFTIPIRAYVQSPLIRTRGTYLQKRDKGTCNVLILQPPFFYSYPILDSYDVWLGEAFLLD
ncbi:MAG: hypothetical protein IKA55_00320, partial [Akkermansia sp.]|nr:hypothetical protein [Akkermansia sp.]